MVDYRLITDLLPVIAFLHFDGRLSEDVSRLMFLPIIAVKIKGGFDFIFAVLLFFFVKQFVCFIFVVLVCCSFCFVGRQFPIFKCFR